MNNRELYKAALIGGFISALSDTIPLLNILNCLCCLGIALGGAAAWYFYQKELDENDKKISLPILVQLGLIAGLFGAFFDFAIHYMMYSLYGNWQIEWLLNMIENMEEVPNMWAEIHEELQADEYKYFAGAALLIRSLILFPVFTLAGTIITNQWMEKRKG